jgi:hypothetical protein
VPERLGAGASNARVPFLLRPDDALTLVLDRGELEFFSENVCQFIQRDIDLECVLPAALPCLSRALFDLTLFTNSIAGLSLALPDAARLLAAKDEARNVDLRDGDRHQVLALSAQDLALGNVLAQVLANAPAHDLAKARMVSIDLQRHEHVRASFDPRE